MTFHIVVHTLDELSGVRDRVSVALAAADLTSNQLFAAKLALEEVVIDAIARNRFSRSPLALTGFVNSTQTMFRLESGDEQA